MSTSETHTSHDEVTALNQLIELGDFIMARRVVEAIDQTLLSPAERQHVTRAQKLLGRDRLAVYVTIAVITCLVMITIALYTV